MVQLAAFMSMAKVDFIIEKDYLHVRFAFAYHLWGG